MTPADHITTLAARLFEARGADLLSFLRRRLANEVDARDIAQETYLRFSPTPFDPLRLRSAQIAQDAEKCGIFVR